MSDASVGTSNSAESTAEGSAESAAVAVEPSGKGHPILIYTLARIGLLVGAGAICYLLGARGILLIVLAFLLSGVVSYIVLYRQRDKVGQRMGGYFGRINRRIEESKSAEDDVMDHDSAHHESPSQAQSAAEDDPDSQK